MQNMKNKGHVLKVCEQFHSVQGEGKNTGINSYFLRLAGCNLACTFCDSKFSWITDDRGIERVTAKELAQGLILHGIPNIVITGGEPFIHDQANMFNFLIEVKEYCMDQKRYPHIEFETNGTIMPINVMNSPMFHFNVSPKLSNSGVPLKNRIVPEVLEFYRDMYSNYRNVSFKFVVDSPESIEEVHNIVTACGIKPVSVFLMPKGTTVEAIRGNSRMAFDKVMEYGYNLSGRLHIDLFGNVRGK